MLRFREIRERFNFEFSQDRNTLNFPNLNLLQLPRENLLFFSYSGRAS